MCNRDVLHVLSLISKSGARHALLTTFETFEATNVDISCDSGGYRALNLQKAPFNLQPPMRFWPEDYPVDQRVGLGLWELPLPLQPPPSPSPSPRPDDIDDDEEAGSGSGLIDVLELTYEKFSYEKYTATPASLLLAYWRPSVTSERLPLSL